MALKDIFDQSVETTAGKRKVRELLAPDRPTVFVSYPMDFTPVCTKQLCSYRDDWGALSALKCRWWGINKESAEKHGRFKSQFKLPMDLVSDSSGVLLGELGLKSLLWVKRGFAVVSPEGEILGTSAIFPWSYRKSEEVREYLEPLLG